MNASPIANSRGSRVAIVVINWNHWQETVKCLESLLHTKGVDSTVFLLDNGSANESWAELRSWAQSYLGTSQDQSGCVWPERHDRPAFHFFKSDENLGFPGGVNFVVNRIDSEKFDFYFLLNSDAVAMPNTISSLVDLSRIANCPLVCAQTRDPESGEVAFRSQKWPWGLFGIYREHAFDPKLNAWPSYYVEGSAQLIEKSFLSTRVNECGYFLEPRFFMYCDDSELGLYARRKGVTPLISGEAQVLHGTSKSAGGAGSPLVYYYITRNRILIANEYLPRWARWLFHFYYPVSRVLLNLPRLVQGRFKVVRAVHQGLVDGYLNHFGKWNHHRAKI